MSNKFIIPYLELLHVRYSHFELYVTDDNDTCKVNNVKPV